MLTSEIKTNELAILTRILEPGKPMLSAAAARTILELHFDEVDIERMHQLSAKAQEGNLTASEKEAMNNYERIGHLLGMMQSKARLTLSSRRGTNGKTKNH